MNRWIGLGVLSVALTGCASGPWAVPDKEYVTVPPKVQVKYIVKPAPTVTVTKQEKLSDRCTQAVEAAIAVGASVNEVSKITYDINLIAENLTVQAFEDDVAGMNKSEADLRDLRQKLREANKAYKENRFFLDQANKECAKEDGQP